MAFVGLQSKNVTSFFQSITVKEVIEIENEPLVIMTPMQTYLNLIYDEFHSHINFVIVISTLIYSCQIGTMSASLHNNNQLLR